LRIPITQNLSIINATHHSIRSRPACGYATPSGDQLHQIFGRSCSHESATYKNKLLLSFL
jgi:hypothetical protein